MRALQLHLHNHLERCSRQSRRQVQGPSGMVQTPRGECMGPQGCVQDAQGNLCNVTDVPEMLIWPKSCVKGPLTDAYTIPELCTGTLACVHVLRVAYEASKMRTRSFRIAYTSPKLRIGSYEMCTQFQKYTQASNRLLQPKCSEQLRQFYSTLIQRQLYMCFPPSVYSRNCPFTKILHCATNYDQISYQLAI